LSSASRGGASYRFGRAGFRGPARRRAAGGARRERGLAGRLGGRAAALGARRQATAMPIGIAAMPSGITPLDTAPNSTKPAEATGDYQWIHVDVERAKREMPGGKTIAHGYLTLSLVPRLAQTIYRVKNRSRGLNYGSNRVRFTGQVPAGSRIRLRQKIKAVEPVEGGVRITSENTVEVEGASRPALVAETIGMSFD